MASYYRYPFQVNQMGQITSQSVGGGLDCSARDAALENAGCSPAGSVYGFIVSSKKEPPKYGGPCHYPMADSPICFTRVLSHDRAHDRARSLRVFPALLLHVFRHRARSSGALFPRFASFS